MTELRTWLEKHGCIVFVFCVILLIDNPVWLLQPDQYWCGVDICNNMKYCDNMTRRCEWCANKRSDCFTSDHIANCSQFCLEQPCSPLGMLNNGVHNGTRVSPSFGTTIQSECNKGFILLGSMVTTCLEFRHWSHDLPICQAKGCNIPKPILNGWISGMDGMDQYTPGTTIMYNCLTGYTLFGDANRTCLANSTWNHEPPVCSPTPINFDDKVIWQVSTGILAALFIASLVLLKCGDRVKRVLCNAQKGIENNRNGKYEKVRPENGKDNEHIENSPIENTDTKLNLKDEDENYKKPDDPQFFDEKLQAIVVHKKDKTQAAFPVPPRDEITVIPVDMRNGLSNGNGHIGAQRNRHMNGYANGYTASHSEENKIAVDDESVIGAHKTGPRVLNPSATSSGQRPNDQYKDKSGKSCVDVNMDTKHVHIHISNSNNNVNNISGGAAAEAKPKEGLKVKEIELTKAVQVSPLNKNDQGNRKPTTRDDGENPTQVSAITFPSAAGNHGAQERGTAGHTEILMNELKKVDIETTEDGAPVVEDQNGIGSLIGISDHTLDINLQDRH